MISFWYSNLFLLTLYNPNIFKFLNQLIFYIIIIIIIIIINIFLKIITITVIIIIIYIIIS